MNLKQLGELGLLHRILRKAPLPPRSVVPIGIGDDAAVLRMAAGRDLIVTTDMLVQGIDFKPEFESYRDIGYKALAVNLSDVASMGGRPMAYLVGLAVPGRMPVTSVDEIYRGMNFLAGRHKLSLIGGDVSASPHGMMITVMVIGDTGRNRAVLRSGARAGDRIYVTGTLGDSRAGLEVLKRRYTKKYRPVPTEERYLIRRHLVPVPRTEFGRLLGRRGWATAMIDLSDGLATDLRHLCEASGVGARLIPEDLPVSRALRMYAHRRGRTAVEYALRGGEDFELLFTVAGRNGDSVQGAARREGLILTRIGEIVPKGRGITLLRKGDREIPLAVRGYEHFRSS